MMPPPPMHTLFPYTTLFRSRASSWSTTWLPMKPAPPVTRTCLPAHIAYFLVLVGRLRQASLNSLIVSIVRGFHRSEEHTSELQSLTNLVCRLLLEKKKSPTK